MAAKEVFKECYRIYRKAVYDDILKIEPCIVCGNPKAHGPHWDYDKPLDVIWYCVKCHGRLHYNLNLGGIVLHHKCIDKKLYPADHDNSWL